MTAYERALRDMIDVATTAPRNRAERRRQARLRRRVVRYGVWAERRYHHEPGKVFDRLIADTNMAVATRGLRLVVASVPPNPVPLGPIGEAPQAAS